MYGKLIAYLLKRHARIDCFGLNFEFLNRLIVSPFLLSKMMTKKYEHFSQLSQLKNKKKDRTNTNSVDKEIIFLATHIFFRCCFAGHFLLLLP